MSATGNICPECGGDLIYIDSLDITICDTCDYEEEECK